MVEDAPNHLHGHANCCFRSSHEWMVNMECLFTQITEKEEVGSARGWLAAHETAAVMNAYITYQKGFKLIALEANNMTWVLSDEHFDWLQNTAMVPRRSTQCSEKVKYIHQKVAYQKVASQV